MYFIHVPKTIDPKQFMPGTTQSTEAPQKHPTKAARVMFMYTYGCAYCL